ncbi:uncharacterized protein [Littorina saxatilis]|uniref:uncharacterized protein n=1 Tax=Littorina saxatilis TaxID=31220 RepID=UPI0038B5D70F
MEGDQFFFFLLMQHNNLHLRQLALVQELMRRRRRRPPAFWVRPWLTAQRRLMYGHFHCLMRELRIEDTASFFNFMRMEPQMFDELVDRLSPRITLQDTNCRKALEPGLKVAVTLRHLASGDRYPSLSYAFRVSRHTIAKFLPLVCQAIVDEYKDEVIACPTTAEEWQAIADEFERKWNVPHATYPRRLEIGGGALMEWFARFSSTRNGNKRRYCVDSDSDDEVRVRATKNNISEAWPRFIVVETADEAQPISKLSPFAIQKVIAGVSSTIDNIKRLRNGSLLIECPSKKASDGLLRLNGQKFVDRPVKVSPHRGLNTSKGVIRCRELEGLSEAEIKEGLKDQGVIDVYRVLIRKGDIRVPTNTLFVTFCTPTIPEKIKVGFVQIRVTLYIPSPMRCFQCQRFGHSKAGCKQKAVCERCGGDPHEGPCTSPPTCTNCKGNHSPSSRECPKYKFEQAIQKTKTEKKMSFSDARKEVEKTNVFSFQKSFAAAVSQRPATKSTPTQTSISYRSVGVQAGPSMLKRTEPTRNKSICTQTDESTGGARRVGANIALQSQEVLWQQLHVGPVLCCVRVDSSFNVNRNIPLDLHEGKPIQKTCPR